MSQTQALYAAIQLASPEEWQLLHRIGKQVALSEFAALLEKGEMPAVALGRSEMATVRGGKRKRYRPACPTYADNGDCADAGGDEAV
ncbi:MAG: hypothetical protein U1E65_22670 [Myxococcota bacterium]